MEKKYFPDTSRDMSRPRNRQELKKLQEKAFEIAGIMQEGYGGIRQLQKVIRQIARMDAGMELDAYLEKHEGELQIEEIKRKYRNNYALTSVISSCAIENATGLRLEESEGEISDEEDELR